MRPVNLLPADMRAKVAGDGDPKVAYAVVGGLVLLLVMVLVTISYSNKATTLQDQAAALQAQADRHQAAVKPVQSYNDFADVVNQRTLLVGGLAESRFPWDTALLNLAKSMPRDVTLDSINASVNGTTVGSSAELILAGCTSGWYGNSRLLVRLKDMPGVSDVTSGSADTSAPSDGTARKRNCGPNPLTFTINVDYNPQTINLVGLPKVQTTDDSGASGATGAVPAAGAPAAATTGP